MKLSSEIVFCVLISGATLATLAYCDFGPHHEELSYLPSGNGNTSAPAEATTAAEAPGFAHAPFALEGPQALPGGQVRIVCAPPSSHYQSDSQPPALSEKASCLERTPGENPAGSLPQSGSRSVVGAAAPGQ